MKKSCEQYRKIYVAIVDFFILFFPTIFFYMVWDKEINQLLYVDFKNKGNWLIIFSYIFVLAIMLLAFKGLKIGYFKVASLLISQFLAITCTQIVITIQLILMVGKVRMLSKIIGNMFVVLVIDYICVFLVTVIFSKLYTRLFPAYRLLHVYGDYRNNLKKKIDTRADRYTIEKDIYFVELMNNKQEMLAFDGVVLNDIPSAQKKELLKYCFDNRIRVYFVPKITDIFVKGAEEINVFDTPLFLCKNMGLSTGQKIVKRIMDIAIAGVVLLITSPIMGIVALAIKIEDGGPVIYSQERCSLNGKCFMLHKFRSMCVDAEKHGGIQLAKKNDDRITKTGRFIRMTRLDELPQLVNVLKGDMSFVGPRPERPEFVELNCKEIPEFQYRMKVKAGLTGYAQVYGKYNTSFLDKLKLDLLYIEKYSILLDIQIILLTIKVIMTKESTEGVEQELNVSSKEISE